MSPQYRHPVVTLQLLLDYIYVPHPPLLQSIVKITQESSFLNLR